jgi:membrane-associated protease RseP (regulator of RpoE activity)
MQLLAALCVLAVPYLPWLLLPLYSLHTGSADGGVMVSSVPPSSPLSTVLTPGDIILSVNFQAVGDTAQWQAAVAGLQQPQGWCVPRDSLAAVTVSSAADAPVYVSGTVAATTTSADDSQCCLQHYRGGHVCFDVLPSADGGSDANSTVRAVCGKASSLVSVATGSCLVSNPSACERDSGSVCVAASSVVYAGASAVVLHTQRRGAVPLLVSPLQLSAAVNVADLRPRAALRWLADAAPRPLECVRDAVFAAPTAAVMVTQAVAIVSISMAVFNVLPVWHFDGQLASACIARAYMRRRYGPPTDADARAAGVVATVANTCTAVVAVTVLASLVSSLSSSAG